MVAMLPVVVLTCWWVVPCRSGIRVVTVVLAAPVRVATACPVWVYVRLAVSAPVAVV